MLSMAMLGCAKKSPNENLHGEKETYYCPMHPEVTSDRPGICPICNMDLVKRPDNTEAVLTDMTGMIELNTTKQVLANVSTLTIKKEDLIKEVSSYSYLDFAEPNRKLISARFSGRIEKLLVDKTGDYVTAGQPLFEIYSPQLVEAQNEYIIARQNATTRTSTKEPDIRYESLIGSARKKLELYGLTEEQIENLEKNQGVQYIVTFHSPISGTVIEKKIQEGMYVNEGALLYGIADMSVLWAVSEVYDVDLNAVEKGSKVKLKIPAFPEEIFEGIVHYIYPVVNNQTRTIRIRSVFGNLTERLKPQMYGEVIFRKNLGKQLMIPEEAVLFTGKRNIVWVKTSNERFESKEITVGIRQNGKYQILSGLSEGDKVAVSGGFLIDSESQLKNGKDTPHQHVDPLKESVVKEKAIDEHKH